MNFSFCFNLSKYVQQYWTYMLYLSVFFEAATSARLLYKVENKPEASNV